MEPKDLIKAKLDLSLKRADLLKDYFSFLNLRTNFLLVIVVAVFAGFGSCFSTILKGEILTLDLAVAFFLLSYLCLGFLFRAICGIYKCFSYFPIALPQPNVEENLAKRKEYNNSVLISMVVDDIELISSISDSNKQTVSEYLLRIKEASRDVFTSFILMCLLWLFHFYTLG